MKQKTSRQTATKPRQRERRTTYRRVQEDTGESNEEQD